jgi:hypothetical protein
MDSSVVPRFAGMLFVIALASPAAAGPERPGAAPSPLGTGGVTKPPPRTAPPIHEEPAPALPTDRGPITTPTFTLSAAQPYAQGRAWLQVYAFQTWTFFKDSYHMTVGGEDGNLASVLVMLDRSLRASSLFTACHVTNADETRAASIVTDTGVEPVKPLTARWLLGTAVIWNPSATTSSNVFVDRCEVTGYGTGTPPQPGPVPADVANARLSGARIARQVVTSRSTVPPPPVEGGVPAASGVTLSARRPARDGARLEVLVIGDTRLGVGAEVRMFGLEDAYTISGVAMEGRDDSNMRMSVDVAVKVARVPRTTATVSCSLTNLTDRATSFAGNAFAPHQSRWVDMRTEAGDGADDVFRLRDLGFWSSVALHECRVLRRASVATSPGSIGPSAAGAGGLVPPRP